MHEYFFRNFKILDTEVAITSGGAPAQHSAGAAGGAPTILTMVKPWTLLWVPFDVDDDVLLAYDEGHRAFYFQTSIQ